MTVTIAGPTVTMSRTQTGPSSRAGSGTFDKLCGQTHFTHLGINSLSSHTRTLIRPVGSPVWSVSRSCHLPVVVVVVVDRLYCTATLIVNICMPEKFGISLCVEATRGVVSV